MSNDTIAIIVMLNAVIILSIMTIMMIPNSNNSNNFSNNTYQ